VVAEGETLDGTYQLQRLVGEGGMGAVYEATHARLAGRYAIKVLLRDLSDRPEIRARFEREARITSLLQHPNVVQVIDHNSTADGTSYLVMEFLSGESLAARLARAGRLAVPAVAGIVDQIAAGLAAAHARGIVHRDLKPDNVFLVPVEGRAGELCKILDFGISKVGWSRDAVDGEICGTPQYMAPEQVEGRVADIDAMTDQYALAVIAYELLTGRNPFAHERIEIVFERVRSGIVLPTGISAAVDAALARAFRGDRALRFPSVTAFAEAFREAAQAPASEPVLRAAPERGGASPVPARLPRRRGGTVRLGLAAAVTIAITSFLGTGAADRAPPPAPVASAPAAAAPASETPVVAAPAETAAPAPPPAAEACPPVQPARGARAARAERRSRAMPAGPVRRPLSPAPGPDPDATLPPSDL
jgi:serine/threonine-protein kinase